MNTNISINSFTKENYFLSNMFPCKITYEGITYQSSEALFQALKLENVKEREQFSKLNGYEAKQLGRKIKLRNNWNDYRIEAMKIALYNKFTQNIELAKRLVGTNDLLLEEGNSHGDVFWGTVKGVGENNLGKLLMLLRETLKEQYGAKKESTIKSKRPTFKVIIAGGRNFNDYERLKRDCDKLLINKRNMGYRIIIISGTAQGADTLGEQYAKEKGYEVLRFPADWTTYGKKAGYIRNVEMSQHADACICFWDNFSRGTRHMIEIARKKEIPTRISYYVDNTRNFI